ncbi:glycosyltransferase family 4 protein [Pseudomonas sp. MAFF 311095]|uniref:Glycosyltransferase family 4 protein n=1 Tax=Pseudomonas petroselini TaxID=2899822 RepID=A0ABS8QYW1_9PSED|nr:glycosyltransferase family 4 protein [Pseudomonas petroselini]MCD7040369.1 glycosyltransferase family 4 protein [Pseudomonas petroselini]MCD7045594.1 glycosyltransferase family 4 protein [Pseudomonas petroselini]MCD7069015.1 glycosyltransferase family 4 protein [Pseudomonas petroselini]MCD7079636.1 glycosyltransferase family 4 protein [Pseudomonas petroselini]
MDYWIYFLIFLVSFLLTALFRSYALKKNILDVPNERSSHYLPTPRGGGVAIVIAFMILLIYAYFSGAVPITHFISFSLVGLFVAAIGFMDDKNNLPARWRLLGHFLAAVWGLCWIGGLPNLELFGIELQLGAFGNVLAVLYLVWMLNLYNFMDGIDGLASLEAICVCAGMCIVYLLVGAHELIMLPLSLAMAVMGFLFWNFPPAKIFMGDAGSSFLGILLGLLSLQAAWHSPKFLWCWLILLGVFIVDATVTLSRRFFRGAKVYEAHRSHAYQFASRRFGKHLPVSLGVSCINIFWLLPVSLSVALSLMDGATALLIAYIPLIFLAFLFDAGKSEIR